MDLRFLQQLLGELVNSRVRPVPHPSAQRQMIPLQILIFNWKGRPNKTTMLDQLSIMTNAAKEIGRPHRKHAFGHLVVLLRDVPDWQDKVCSFSTREESPS